MRFLIILSNSVICISYITAFGAKETSKKNNTQCIFHQPETLIVCYDFSSWTDINSYAFNFSNPSAIYMKAKRPLVLTNELDMENLTLTLNSNVNSNEYPFAFDFIHLKGISVFPWFKNNTQFLQLINQTELYFGYSQIELYVNETIPLSSLNCSLFYSTLFLQSKIRYSTCSKLLTLITM
jgi:hypothetical protein